MILAENQKFVNEFRDAELAKIREAKDSGNVAALGDLIASFKKLTYETILSKKNETS